MLIATLIFVGIVVNLNDIIAGHTDAAGMQQQHSSRPCCDVFEFKRSAGLSSQHLQLIQVWVCKTN